MKRFNRSIYRIYLSAWVWLPLIFLSACKGPERKAYEIFVSDVKTSLNIRLLQQQAHDLMNVYTLGKQVPVESLPIEVRMLPGGPPSFAQITKWSDSNDRAMMIVWGNGFAHWGIIVGNASFKMPKTHGLEVTTLADGVGLFFQTK